MKKNYADNLPRVIPRGNRRRCCALDGDGNRCGRMATCRDYYFGDVGTSSYGWVVVEFCDTHKQRDCKSKESPR